MVQMFCWLTGKNGAKKSSFSKSHKSLSHDHDRDKSIENKLPSNYSTKFAKV